jgi:hypothetical protein
LMFGYGVMFDDVWLLGDAWWCLVMGWGLMMFGYWAMLDDAWLWGDVWGCLVIGRCLMMFGYGVTFDDVWLLGNAWWCLVMGWCLVWKELGLGFKSLDHLPTHALFESFNLSFLSPHRQKRYPLYTLEEDKSLPYISCSDHMFKHFFLTSQLRPHCWMDRRKSLLA